MEYKRTCPKCDVEKIYKHRGTFRRDTIENRLCRKCYDVNRKPFSIDGWKKECPKCGNQMTYKTKRALTVSINTNKVCKHCMRLGFPNLKLMGRKIPDSQRLKMSIAQKGKKHHWINRGFLGKTHTEENKRQIRIRWANHIQKYGTQSRNFNPKACLFIDQLNVMLGMSFQHALNGGEHLINGYFPDGYDKDKNIIFEYDEPNHRFPKQKQKDLIRQEILIGEIKPTMFLRYDEHNNRLYDAETQSEIQITI